MDLHYFTICSANYLAYARTLYKSLNAVHPNASFTLFLADDIDERFSVEALGFDVVEMSRLDCPNLYDMAARYTVMELNTAIKPFCFQYLFTHRKALSAIYLDPDIYIVSELLDLVEVLHKKSVDIVLTPHSTSPLDDGKNPDDHQLMRAGAYNLGFCAVKNTRNSRNFLDWWSRNLEAHCIVDVANGIFVDQKFCDLVPSYFENVLIFRHPGYNVAYWNLLGREFSSTPDGAISVNRKPLRFFHFSGIVPGDESIFSKHQDRYTPKSLGAAKSLFAEYHRELRGHATLNEVDFGKLDYRYSQLSNGIRITDAMRMVYRAVMPPAVRSREEAFSAAIGLYLLHEPRVLGGGAPITRLMYEIWRSRHDLQDAFALRSAEGRQAFLNWFLGTSEHKTPAEIVEATRAMAQTLPIDSLTMTGIVVQRQAKPDRREDIGRRWASIVRRQSGLSVGLDMVGPFRSPTGLGTAVRSNFLAARRAGLSVNAYDSGRYRPSIDPGFALRHDTPSSDTLLFHINADETARLECIVDPRLLHGRRKIGYWAWELESLPPQWSEAFHRVDEIWTPSSFSAHAIAKKTQKPVIVVPHPVTTPPMQIRTSEARAAFGLPDDAVIFLTAFDLSSYMQRKNPLAAINAFKAAFPYHNQHVILVLKVHGRIQGNGSFDDLADAIGNDPRIRIINRQIDAAKIEALQWACDVFVSLHRSEGFGLWIAECMAKEKACIVTNYSGSVDFANASNSMPIGFSMIPVKRGEYPYGPGRWWADPDFDEAVDAFRVLAANAGVRAQLGKAANATVRNRLNPDRVGRLIAQRLFASRAESFDLPAIHVGGPSA